MHTRTVVITWDVLLKSAPTGVWNYYRQNLNVTKIEDSLKVHNMSEVLVTISSISCLYSMTEHYKRPRLIQITRRSQKL